MREADLDSMAEPSSPSAAGASRTADGRVPRVGLVALPPLLARGLVAALGAERAAWQIDIMSGFEAADLYVLHVHDAAEATALQASLPAGVPALWLGHAPAAEESPGGAGPEPPTWRPGPQHAEPPAWMPGPLHAEAAAWMPGPLRAEAVLDDDATPQQLRAALAALLAGLSVHLPWRMPAKGASAEPAAATRARRAPPQAEPGERSARAEAAARLAEATEPLTTRELEVYELIAKGLSNRDIASVLGISAHTAKFHVAQILAKVGAATRAEAVALGLRLGLIGL